MARFAEIADLLALKGTDRVERISMDQAAQERALETASSEALGYLQTRYPGSDIPATAATTPPSLVAAVCSMALRVLAGSHQVVEEEIQTAYLDAVRYLRDVSRGLADLGLISQPAADTSRPEVLSLLGPEDLRLGGGNLDQW